jgi:NAD(P)-dependent dehydrogenase (short-subunit alcohol dehydrogenase family)
LAVPADITNARQVDDAFLKISETFGKIDVLVCNSAFMPVPRPVLSPDFDVQDWWAAFSTNILGALYTVKGFVKYAAEGAHILHISTCVGHMPPLEAGVSAYAASKAAGAKLFDYIAFENPELHVVNVHPGLVDTDMSRKSGHGGMDHSKLPKISLVFCSLHETSQAVWVTIKDKTDRAAVDLPGHFCLWLVSSEANFLRGKFVWVNWDVDELRARKEEILSTDLLDTKLGGVSFVGWDGSQKLGGL